MSHRTKLKVLEDDKFISINIYQPLGGKQFLQQKKQSKICKKD